MRRLMRQTLMQTDEMISIILRSKYTTLSIRGKKDSQGGNIYGTVSAV